MAWKSVTLQPGLNAEVTPTALQAGYASTTLGRFKAGLFQKLGGWSKYISVAIGGSPRATHAWQAINKQQYLAIGSTAELGIVNNGLHSQITPQTFLSDTAINFSTSAGSNVVTVVDTNISGITSYDAVFFNTPVSVDGIILSGLYAVNSTLSSTSYTILAATNGLAGVTSGGTVPAFTTVSASPNITVTLAKHGLVAGNDITFAISTTVGGIAISGRYIVQSITDANNFVIVAATAASSSAGPTNMNTNKAKLVYTIALGPIQAGGAYGAGNYGAGAYGLGVAISGQSGTPITATDWTLANWGQNLIACPEGGGIYQWAPGSGFANAGIIPNAPYYNNGVFVSTAQQTIIAYGSTVPSTIGVYQDPMWINWCDVQNLNSWTPAVPPATPNQAGGFRIPSGSHLVGGASTPVCNLLWTDLDVWVMSYVGSQLVYGFVKGAENCGLIGKHAFTKLAGSIYWLGANNFFVYGGGGAAILPSPVWDIVFQDLDATNAWKCFAGSNTLFSEVLFAYPSISGGLGICDKYVKYNTVENSWDAGTLQRNTWMDQTILGAPIATTDAGIVYVHETGMDADTSPMTSGFTTGYFFVDEGESFVSIDRIYPDFRWGNWAGAKTAQIQLYVYALNYPGDTPIAYGPYAVNSSTEYVPVRIRARQLAMGVYSSDSGSFWRTGHMRIRYNLSGRR